MMRMMSSLSILLLVAGMACAAADTPALKIYGMDSKPISYTDTGQPTGMAVELARRIQDRLGRHDAIDIVPWARAQTLAEAGPNVMLLTVVRTPERERQMQFVGPIFTSRVVAYVVKGRLAELQRRDPGLYKSHAGARRGSIFVNTARGLGFNVTDETNTSEIAAKMLMSGRFDLWFDGEELMPGAMERAGHRPDEIEVALRLGTAEVYFAFSNGTPKELVEAWAGALRELKRDGSLQKIQRKWMAAPPEH
ncbi:ABC transporter substrate-binding protein [Duganella sp. BJB475]|nr:ABC transporter substrate-binding protein [Duganella sp. BJB475]RFP32935.1 ABC transporter substrate-binding protein [Duganella sp. BJB476]